MSVIPEHFKLEFAPVAARESVVQHGSARFTVLTDRLIRLEYHPQNCFEDRPTQAFWFREQPVPEFTVETNENGFEIETAYLLLKYMPVEDGFTANTLSILVKATNAVWHPGAEDPVNLGGTTRTLDFINGYIPLEAGLMSRSGWSIIDDSTSLVFNNEGWLEPRADAGIDLYFFGYGLDYKACLQDYCRISGQAPLIPRWILGNWWSRYWAYSQAELSNLLDDFQHYELPFSVCIIDMDWHLTETGNSSTGWTGYTWNRNLFPEPTKFLQKAHEDHLKIGLNLHPAEGIHDHEEQYELMAIRTAIDPLTKQPVAFNITDPAFASAYFEVLHHPYEKMGVDFWWIDWQQGQKSAITGLDPLWLINHLHFYDLGREGQRRPFIFSRWGNEGHQRYPIGFSGDSYVTWDTLAFESYMTATASNIAYGWWSHDIGGHTSGVEDSELLTRWIQFGVLSPINRIHVTKGLFYDRRPWMFEDAEVLRVLQKTLQLRHALVPYLYTMAQRAHQKSLPLILPMYYDYPDEEAAYHCPQQYLFGSQLVAAPFVSPADPDTQLSRHVIWLPEGNWYNFFSGQQFSGGWHSIYGRLEDIPLFAKAGAVVPLASNAIQNGTNNPDAFDLHLFAGADGSFTLYEDDGETTAYISGQGCTTTFSQAWHGNRLDITIAAAQGDSGLIPHKRTYHLFIHGISDDVTILASVNSAPIAANVTYHAASEMLEIEGITLSPEDSLKLLVHTDADSLLARRDRTAENVLRLLKFFKLNTGVRNTMANRLEELLSDPAKLTPYLLAMTDSQGQALFELLFDAGIHHIPDTQVPNLLLLWNNREDARITYRYDDIYLWFGGVPSANGTHGIAPKFTYIIPPIKSWSHGAQNEHVHRTQWRLQIDYANLFTATVQHREPSP